MISARNFALINNSECIENAPYNIKAKVRKRKDAMEIPCSLRQVSLGSNC